jgi:hypothetical protein
MPHSEPYRPDGSISADGLEDKVDTILGILHEFGDEDMSEETKAANLLANLKRFCEATGEDFERAIRVCQYHSEAESGYVDPDGIAEADIPQVKWAEEQALNEMLDRFGTLPDPREDQLADIVTDLRHACASLDMNFDHILATAHAAYAMQAVGSRLKF